MRFSPRFFLATTLCAGVGLPATAPAQKTYVVDTTLDTPDVNPGDGKCADSMGRCSLRAAVQEANALGGVHIVQLQSGKIYKLTRGGAGEDAALVGDLDITANIILFGADSTVDASRLDRAFDVQKAAGLAVNNLTIRDGLVNAESGGAYRVRGVMLMSGCEVTSCDAKGSGASGGAIFNDGGELWIENSDFSNCSAERAGGAIEAFRGVSMFEACSMHDNYAGAMPGNGGAFHLTADGIVILLASDFRGNVAAREGGALWNSGTGAMLVERCIVARNRADGMAADDGGGGIFNDGGLMYVGDTFVSENQARMGSGSGGGLFNNSGTLMVFRSLVEKNRAMRAGGGLEARDGTTTITGSWLIANETGAAPGNGGALHLTGAGKVDVTGTAVRDNLAAAEGGGLWNSASGQMTVTDCDFVDNIASGDAADQGGGALFNDGGTMTVADSTIRGNVADGSAGSGGGVLNNRGTLTVRNTFLSQNDAKRAGGAIEANVGTTKLDSVQFFQNTTGSAPGNGGALHLTGAAMATLDNGIVASNSAANEGGGLWNSTTGTLLVTKTVIANNSSPKGADVFNKGGTFKIDGKDVPKG